MEIDSLEVDSHHQFSSSKLKQNWRTRKKKTWNYFSCSNREKHAKKVYYFFFRPPFVFRCPSHNDFFHLPHQPTRLPMFSIRDSMVFWIKDFLLHKKSIRRRIKENLISFFLIFLLHFFLKQKQRKNRIQIEKKSSIITLKFFGFWTPFISYISYVWINHCFR